MAAAETQQTLIAQPFGGPRDHYGTLKTSAILLKEEAKPTPRDVVATFNYFKPNADGRPPQPSYAGKPETYERPLLPMRLVVHDIRGSEQEYTLDTKGFQVVKHESKEKEFLNDDQIKNVYYPETEELLKKVTGASKIFIFDHTIRRESYDARNTTPDPKQTATLRGPVQRVHIDQSYSAGRSRVPYHLPDEAETLLKGRYQIINVWRPIVTILKDPLGVAEANSVSDDELVPIKLIYPNREGETYSVKASSKHKWHYFSRQTPSDVLLIKCFDSKTDGRARRVPHSAFVDDEFVGERARESIEVRALVFHPDDID